MRQSGPPFSVHEDSRDFPKKPEVPKKGTSGKAGA